MFLMILLNTLPFPAAPNPSNKTSTGSFASLTLICKVASFSLAADSLSLSSSSFGFVIDAIVFSIGILLLTSYGKSTKWNFFLPCA